jgi:hypothetical protein
MAVLKACAFSLLFAALFIETISAKLKLLNCADPRDYGAVEVSIEIYLIKFRYNKQHSAYVDDFAYINTLHHRDHHQKGKC